MTSLPRDSNYIADKVMWPKYGNLVFLSDSIRIRTHNHLVWKQTLNQIVKWLSDVYKLSDCGFQSCCCHLNLRFSTCLSKEFLDIQAAVECRFTLKLVHDMIMTYSQYFYERSDQNLSFIRTWPERPIFWWVVLVRVQ